MRGSCSTPSAGGATLTTAASHSWAPGSSASGSRCISSIHHSVFMCIVLSHAEMRTCHSSCITIVTISFCHSFIRKVLHEHLRISFQMTKIVPTGEDGDQTFEEDAMDACRGTSSRQKEWQSCHPSR